MIPEHATGRENDVYVSAVNMKEALHGDRVVATIRSSADPAEAPVPR
mgnify:CR=1 FL=1